MNRPNIKLILPKLNLKELQNLKEVLEKLTASKKESRPTTLHDIGVLVTSHSLFVGENTIHIGDPLEAYDLTRSHLEALELKKKGSIIPAKWLEVENPDLHCMAYFTWDKEGILAEGVNLEYVFYVHEGELVKSPISELELKEVEQKDDGIEVGKDAWKTIHQGGLFRSQDNQLIVRKRHANRLQLLYVAGEGTLYFENRLGLICPR